MTTVSMPLETGLAGLSREELLTMYAIMRQIRTFEDTLSRLFAAGGIPGFVHLYAGQEGVAVGVMTALTAEDAITSHHRGHGHCIAKGVDVSAMLAEIFGKATGVCKGKGGSMHIADLSKGMLGANGIVGGGIPLAVGAALAFKVRKLPHVCVCFFSDGATNQGTFHEGLNMASIWDLPVVFVCENNGYAETTSIEYSARVERLSERAASYGMPGVTVDGQNVLAVYSATRQAVARARAGQGPTLIEAKTYRYYGHFEGDTLKYRTAEEDRYFRDRDPLKVFAEEIAPQAEISAADMQAQDERAEQRMAEALRFAESSPFPEPADCLTDVYASY